MLPAPRVVDEESYARYFTPRRIDDRSSDAERQAIGYLGLFLPVLLVSVAAWRATDAAPGWPPLDSISEYYHSGAVAILTGVLAILALFLATYRGFRGGVLDVRAGRIAAFAALGVSVFPTAAIEPLTAPAWWMDWMDYVHFGCATALFGSFAFYSLVLFPKGDASKADKRRRNHVYRVCGAGILGAMLWALIAHEMGGHIFWPETLALELFGISWLTKGRALHTLRQVLGPGP